MTSPECGLITTPNPDIDSEAPQSIVCALRPMRNQRGTGHGRAHPPDVEAEHALIAGDAAFLWCRWALRRLGPYLLGDMSVLINRLQRGLFPTDVLTERLAAVDLPRRSAEEAHLLGTAVGQRAVRETFNVQIEGVNAAIVDPDAWSPAYRAGVIEGLLFSADGTLTTSPKAIESAVQLLAAQPNAIEVVEQLNQLAETGVWTAPAVGRPPDLEDVTRAIKRVAPGLSADLRASWLQMARSIEVMWTRPG